MAELKVIEETTQYIKIVLGNEQFGIDIKYIDSIVKMQTITRVPKVARYLRGVINIRGEIIPIMCLRIKMGMDDVEETKYSRIIILRMENGDKLGIIVDQVRDVIALGADNIEKACRDAKDETSNYVFGIGKDNDNLISLLDINEIINVV